MTKQLTPAEVGQILGYKDGDTVRRIMRQMVHMENPLRVTEKTLEAWISQRTYGPGGGTKAKQTRRRTEETANRIPRRKGGKTA